MFCSAFAAIPSHELSGEYYGRKRIEGKTLQRSSHHLPSATPLQRYLRNAENKEFFREIPSRPLAVQQQKTKPISVRRLAPKPERATTGLTPDKIEGHP